MFLNFQEVAMKKRLAFAAFVLVASMHACNLPHEEIVNEPDVNVTKVTRVVVTPPSGPGDFKLEVTYESMWIAGRPPGSIICRYITPDGATIGIGRISVFLEHINTHETETHTSSIPFSVKRNGVVTPGKYMASCTDERNVYTVESNFIVIGTATAPASTATSTLLIGRITFALGTARSDRPGASGDLDDITRWCIPEITIAADGNLTGSCEFTGQTALLTESTVRATVTGSAVRGGDFNFSYQVQESGPNGWKTGDNPVDVHITSTAAQWYVFYTGTGKFTSPTRAEGTANFEYTCMSGASNLLWCSSSEMETFKGTVDWNFAE
jgi:hypothetical protein